eukprot:TRINITY_DN7995_c2_g1_i1.p1 TRINITY_DN7995_c2_g1~~TRINITY_DN7995_c2_g1_i1.p1  ORF type:complete len:100 (+),score=12.62 TRINITY_DN7995_c2_g1_i1:38-337(+)
MKVLRTAARRGLVRFARWESQKPPAEPRKSVESHDRDRMWQLAAPERAWTLTHPATWVLLAMIIGMQYSMYVKHGGTYPSDEELAAKRGEQIKEKVWDE